MNAALRVKGDVIWTVLLLLLLLVLSGFFSGAELAVFSLNDAKVRALQEEGRRGADTLLLLKQRPERLLTTILVGNNVVNIGSASLATALALDLFGNRGVAISTGVMTLLVLIFGEITPKSFATANAHVIAPAVAPVLALLARVLTPIVMPLELLTRWMVSLTGGSVHHAITEGEIREMTLMGHRHGSIDEHERQIIERAFLMDETPVADVMTPRVEMHAWPADRTVAEIAPELPTVRHSRVPIYGTGIDNIVGILYIREAYEALVSGREAVTLRELARDPYLVPASLPLTRMLAEFQARRMHMAVVIDEYGGTDGIVTLEDVLEELVGDILDETDLVWQPVVRLSATEILVDGAAELRELNRIFDTAFPLEEHRSLNGYLLDEMGHVPASGDQIEREGVRIRILQATDTQILRARLTLPPEAPTEV